MAFVAVDLILAFVPPRACIEYPVTLGAGPVSRTTEKAFCNKMVTTSVRATFRRGIRVRAGAIQSAAADWACFWRLSHEKY